MVRDLLWLGEPVETQDHFAACCEEFALHFEGGIAQIRSELDPTIDVSSALCLGQILMDEFQLLRPDECGQGVWICPVYHHSARPLPILANWEIYQGDSYMGLGSRQLLLERGSSPYHFERGGDLTAP